MNTASVPSLMSLGKCVRPYNLINMCTRVTRSISALVLLAVTKYHKLGCLNNRHVLSQFWRLKVRNQCVSRATLPLKPVRADPSSPFLSF